MISYSNNVVAFSFIWFYRSQMCLITYVPGFGVIDFFASFSQYQQSYLFIFVVVASFLNHKQWSPKFLALGNQGDLSIPGFGEKFIGVEAGGTLDLHGEGKLSWTKLQGTIKGFSAISSSFSHKVHVFQVYAGKSKYKLTSKDRIKAFQGTYISFLRIQLNDIYYYFLKSFLRQYIIFISGSIGQ